ncbi:hypothetical protein [Burkholderia pseudomallei]|uniref:hypothetical protein n=1 Tax=Burkholderia pseudomallei TaxID=28450 RepID=UPI003F68827F
MRFRAPCMSSARLAIIVWGTFTASFANLFAVPAVSPAFRLLWLDRNVGTHFFDVAAGGRPPRRRRNACRRCDRARAAGTRGSRRAPRTGSRKTR